MLKNEIVINDDLLDKRENIVFLKGDHFNYDVNPGMLLYRLCKGYNYCTKSIILKQLESIKRKIFISIVKYMIFSHYPNFINDVNIIETKEK
jgi:hypothetical protein